MIRLAIFDLDGTLLNTDKSLSEDTVEAVKALKKSGVNVAVATGRGFEMAAPYVRRLGLFEGPIVTFNGAMIHELSDKRLYSTHAVGKEAQKRMCDFAAENGHPFVIYNTSGVHTLSNERVRYYEDWNEIHPEDAVRIHIHESVESLKAIEANKLLINIEDESTFDTAARMVESMELASATKSQDHLLDVVSPRGTKGEGADYLMAHYGVTPEETIAFGDNDNDAQMLERIPLSFAMKNATMKAKQAASYSTALDNDSAGVANALHKYILKNTE